MMIWYKSKSGFSALSVPHNMAVHPFELILPIFKLESLRSKNRYIYQPSYHLLALSLPLL